MSKYRQLPSVQHIPKPYLDDDHILAEANFEENNAPLSGRQREEAEGRVRPVSEALKEKGRETVHKITGRKDQVIRAAETRAHDLKDKTRYTWETTKGKKDQIIGSISQSITVNSGAVEMRVKDMFHFGRRDVKPKENVEQQKVQEEVPQEITVSKMLNSK